MRIAIMKKNLSNLVVSFCRTNLMVWIYPSVGLKYLIVLAISFCFVQTLTAETDLDIELEIKQEARQELVSRQWAIYQYREAINNKRLFIAELLEQLGVAFLSEDERRMQNILRVLVIELNQLQRQLVEQDLRFEEYRLFIYRLLSSAARKRSYVTAQPISPKWQALAEQAFNAMSPEAKAAIAPAIKSIRDSQKGRDSLSKARAAIPRLPYSNMASLIDKHDNAFLTRLEINLRKESADEVKSMVYGLIDLYKEKEFLSEEFSSEEFYQEDYKDLRESINRMFIDFSEEVPVENPYSPVESEMAQ